MTSKINPDEKSSSNKNHSTFFSPKPIIQTVGGISVGPNMTVGGVSIDSSGKTTTGGVTFGGVEVAPGFKVGGIRLG